jgi:hypothetical protein
MIHQVQSPAMGIDDLSNVHFAAVLVKGHSLSQKPSTLTHVCPSLDRKLLHSSISMDSDLLIVLSNQLKAETPISETSEQVCSETL